MGAPDRTGYACMSVVSITEGGRRITLDGVKATIARLGSFDPNNNHVWGALASIAAVWALALAYLVLMPASYVSHWTMILPGSGSTSSMSLETIGQASSTPAGHFSSAQMSPKVIYKEIAESEQVRQAAAKALNMKLGQFGKPRVKLIDETSLMLFEMGAKDPALAHNKANALIDAFGKQLDLLRRDELDKRSSAVRDNLKSYQAQLNAARARISAMQRETGIISATQFNEATSSIVLTRRKMADISAELAKSSAEQDRLAARLGVSPELAAVALKLAADPSFAKLAGDYAEGSALFHGDTFRLGPKNPYLINARRKQDAALARMEDIARTAGIDLTPHLKKLLLLANTSHQADLFKALISVESTVEGRRRELAALETGLNQQEARVRAMSQDAARLEDLRKDHLVAEAVFTSALARLDTTKSDIYGSYPIVQILASPDLPDSQLHPRPGYALAGGIAGSLMSSIAWMLLWLRTTYLLRRRKSA